MTTAIDNPYCIHAEPCEECKRPSDVKDCNFCGADTTDFVIDEDPNVGYSGRVYYCERHKDCV
jgi:hypothetical protein